MSREGQFGDPLDPAKVRRIGVFKFRNIGDVLMITPSLRALRESFPNARITAAVNAVTDAMLQGNPHLDRILVYDRTSRKQSLPAQLIEEFRFFREIRRSRFDLTIDFTSGDRPAGYSLLSGAGCRLGFRTWQVGWNWRNRAYTRRIPYPRERMHEVERHQLLLDLIGIRRSDPSLVLRVDESARRWAEEIVRPMRPARVVHLHPVARWLFKCWDDARMAAVIDWLELEKGARVVVTGSDNANEMAKTENIVRSCRSRPLVLSGRTTLGQVAAISSLADCFFGVDTAPMHAAAAVGTPVVCLFGPTDPRRWHPWCKKQVTLHKGCPCEAGTKPRCEKSRVQDCLMAITVEDAKAALAQFLA